ncbi:MAG: neutral/alkaline non-lysosomal ceramidase N-terminal domain-containing protein [Sedimentisphaerales bacterium]
MRRNYLLRSIVSILLLSVLFCSTCFAELKGGCGKANITPPLGGLLIGSKGYVSDDVLDELYARALVLSDGDKTVAIVACDLLYTPLEEITTPVRRIVKEKTGIPAENVLVCATHTHSGPEVFTRSKFAQEKIVPVSAVDRSYLAALVGKIASAVLLAHKHMQDVQVGAAKGEAPQVVFNRRPRDANGLVQEAFTLPPEVLATRKVVVDSDGQTRVTFAFPEGQPQRRFGPVDPAVRVLRVEDPNGILVGSVVNFGCHPVTIYPFLSTSISADYPAYARRVVEQAEGGLCLFTLGLAGDAVPFDRGIRPRQEIGRAVGGEALKALQFLPTSGDVTLDAIKKEISLPTKKASSENGEASGDEPQPITTELQVLRLGDIYILGLPGEILAEVGLDIQKRAGLEKLFIFSVSNDAIGYVPHSAAYDEGGYEPGAATKLAKGAAEIMVEQALDLIEQIRQE